MTEKVSGMRTLSKFLEFPIGSSIVGKFTVSKVHGVLLLGSVALDGIVVWTFSGLIKASQQNFLP